MPLKPGSSSAVIGHNVTVEENAGKPKKQAVAIALHNAGVTKSQDKTVKHIPVRDGASKRFAKTIASRDVQPIGDGSPEKLEIVASVSGESIWKVKTSGGAIRYTPHLSGGLYPSVQEAKEAVTKKAKDAALPIGDHDPENVDELERTIQKFLEEEKAEDAEVKYTFAKKPPAPKASTSVVPMPADPKAGKREPPAWMKDEEPKTPKYDPVAVNKEIAKDPRIKGKEAKLIHSLLKGWRGGDSEPPAWMKDSAETKVQELEREYAECRHDYLVSKKDGSSPKYQAVARQRMERVGKELEVAKKEKAQDSFNSLVSKLERGGKSKEYATKIAGKVAAEKGKDSVRPVSVGRDGDWYDERIKELEEEVKRCKREGEPYADELRDIAEYKKEQAERKRAENRSAGRAKDAVRPVSVGRDGEWDDNVAVLTQSIKKAVQSAKKDGATAMSKANLKQVISTRGVNLPNRNAFERAFEEAVSKAGLGKFILDSVRPV